MTTCPLAGRMGLTLQILATLLFLPSPAEAGGLLNGYAGGAAGEHIDYHSFHPYATGALLSRCTDGKQIISWRTEPIPELFPEETATFAWIGGHSTGSSSADAAFSLRINGESVLRFTTVKAERVWKWRAEGAKGVSLDFEGRWEDSVHDLFGYFFLTVPVREFGKGKALALSIVGDSLDRRDWYMTFKYEMRESVVVQSQPALLRTAAGPRQLVDVLIDHVQRGGSAEISTSLGDRLHAALQMGFNTLQLPVAAVREPRDVDVEVAVEGQALRRERLLLREVRAREFWVLPHSHNDIGYSDLQADVEKKQLRNLRDAVALWKKTSGNAPEARFKWNTEILWAVDRFFATASEEEKRQFIAAVKGGGIGLNGLYANQLTGICRPEELLRLTDFARTLRKRYGVKVTDAMITDIPGVTWAAVPALALGGIRYFSSGPNFIPSLPDGGDRVGHFNSAWGDRPFYWVSPSGREKILFWVAGKGYSWFHGWILGRMGERTAWHLLEYLKDLDARGYPYDMVQLRYTIGGDNGPTDPDLPEFVRQWNEKYVSPRLVIATASAMFEEFERRWGATLPSYSGEITPYWEDGAVSTLRELGTVRRSSERLVQAEAAACLTGATGLEGVQLEEAWRNVHLFDEHTWGAWNSVSDPDNSFAVAQWGVKREYARKLEDGAAALMRHALASPPRGKLLEVLNTSSWSRTDLVCIGRDLSGVGDLIVGEDGVEVPSQRLSTGELAFLARDVPALGSRCYAVRPGGARTAGALRVEGRVIAAGGMTVEVDPRTGAICRLEASGGRQFADTTFVPGLNQYLYVPGRDPAAARRNSGAKVTVKEAGPLLAVLGITSDAPGCVALEQEIRVVDGLERVELVNRFDRARVREKEGVHMAFPFSLPRGRFRLDGGWGIVRPEADQLPGSCKDYFSAGRWVDCSNQEYGITLTLMESPLVEIGAMTDETLGGRGVRLWRTEVPSGTVCYSYGMNNYWHTNYKADQEGPATLSYALYPHGMFSALDAYRHGVEQSQPLLVRPVSGKGTRSLFTVTSPGVVVTSLKRSADGKGLMVRLYAASGRPEEFSIDWGGRRPRRVLVSSPDEGQGDPVRWPLTLPAFGVVTLRCEE